MKLNRAVFIMAAGLFLIGAKVFAAQNFGSWKVIYQRDGEVGGVYDSGDLDTARQFVEQYLAGQIK